MPTAVLYCRVSSDEQAQKDISVPAQKKLLQRWIDDHPDWTLLAEFKDEGESAYAPADKRPGLREMLAYCKKQKVTAILVHKLDRFSRYQEESVVIKAMLRKHGTTVKSITENFDPATPQGFLYEGMIEVINQFYSMNLATETMKGMTENAERGYYNGGPVPYGYRVEKFADAKGQEHGRLVLGDEEAVATIQRMFDMAVNQGMGARSIANELNRLGIHGPRKKHWTNGSVDMLLGNVTYTGDTIWNKTKKVGRDGRTATAEAERVVVRGTHPAIVSHELFEARKSAAKERMFSLPTSKAQHVEYLLSRLIRCENCGSSFCGRKMNNRINKKGDMKPAYAYYCAGYMNKGPSVCASLPLRKEWLENTVLAAIRTRFAAPDAVGELERALRESTDALQKSYACDSKQLEAKLADIDRRIGNFVRAIGEGADPAMCQAQIAELNGRKAEVERQASVARRGEFAQRVMERNLAALRRITSAVQGDFASLPFETQRQVVLKFVAAASVNRERLRLELHIPFDGGGVTKLADELSGVVTRGSLTQGTGRKPASSTTNGEPYRPRLHLRRPRCCLRGTSWFRSRSPPTTAGVGIIHRSRLFGTDTEGPLRVFGAAPPTRRLARVPKAQRATRSSKTKPEKRSTRQNETQRATSTRHFAPRPGPSAALGCAPS